MLKNRVRKLENRAGQQTRFEITFGQSESKPDIVIQSTVEAPTLKEYQAGLKARGMLELSNLLLTMNITSANES